MKIKYLILSVLFVFPFFTHAETFVVEKSWFNYAYQADGSGFQLTSRFEATIPNTMSPGQSGIVTGRTSMSGSANGITPLGQHECPFGIGCVSPGQNFIFTSPGVFTPVGFEGGPTNNGTFTAPTTPGNYKMGFFASFNRDPTESAVGWCVRPEGGVSVCPTPFSYQEYTISVIGTQCNDGINNDSDNLIDVNDPDCWSCPGVPGSYVATHNSESTPPGGTCPAPASLQLNGRAAFFQVVKNFFASITARAFAGE